MTVGSAASPAFLLQSSSWDSSGRDEVKLHRLRQRAEAAASHQDDDQIKGFDWESGTNAR